VATKERLPVEISGTFDIECSDWSRFALGVVYDGAKLRHWWGTESDLAADDVPAELGAVPDDREYGIDRMIDYMRIRGGIWYGHGMGIFDGLAVLERARAREIPCQVDRSAHRVTRVVMGSLTMRDSYSLWPVPLDDICGALRRPVPHLPWPCVCGKKTCSCGRCGGCGGYCQIGERAMQGDPDLLSYCEADCTTLYDGLHKLRDFATSSRICLRGTLAQTAWIAAQDELGVPDSDLPWHLWRAARKADKGGRVAIIRPRAKGTITHWDMNSCYPAQLAKTEVPIGKVRELSGKQASLALGNTRPGIYTLTVNVPDDSFLPPLPWTHGGLKFPVGTFSGAWCLPELVAAFERGVTVVKAHSALIWEATAPVFAELVKRWYEIRRSVGKKTPLGQWVSRLAKALTGKFAEKPERQRVLMHPSEIKVCMRIGKCREGCTGRCGAYEQLDLKGQIWGVPYQRLGGSSYPQWSSYLRASARVAWLEQAERQGTDLIFGNTDSIWTMGRNVPAPAGDGLGEWEFQESWSELDLRSHTVYAGRKLPDRQRLEIDYSHTVPDAELVTHPGEYVVRGIPWATEEDWKRGAGQIDRGVMTFGHAVASTTGLFQKRVRKWSLPKSQDRVIWGDRRLTAGGYTIPLHALEIQEQVKIARDTRKRLQAPAPSAKKAKARKRART
jgi:hypothetical protein